jgi:hypothetical protein
MAVNFPDSPSNGDTYVVGGVTYAYNSTKNAWETIGGAITTTGSGDTPPANPADGDLWFNSASAELSVRYNDGTSSQWVTVSGAVGATPNLSAVAEDILPDADSSRDLGSPTKKWKSLYLSSNTLFLGDSGSISAGPGGEIILPSIKIGTGANAVRLEAATDGKLKTKRIAGGVEQPETSANAAAVSDTAPANPNDGDTWFDTTDASLNVYYNDGSSAQWVGIN